MRQIVKYLLVYALIGVSSFCFALFIAWRRAEENQYWLSGRHYPLWDWLSTPLLIMALFDLAMGVMGFFSLRFSYARGAGTNPTMAREAIEDVESEPDYERDDAAAIACLLAGLTLLLIWAIMFQSIKSYPFFGQASLFRKW